MELNMLCDCVTAALVRVPIRNTYVIIRIYIYWLVLVSIFYYIQDYCK